MRVMRDLSSDGYCWRSRRSAYVAGLRAANREVRVRFDQNPMYKS